MITGRNRQVRRMLAAVGLPVLRLHRAAVGTVDLSGLRPGEWQEIGVPQAWRDGGESRPGGRSHTHERGSRGIRRGRGRRSSR